MKLTKGDRIVLTGDYHGHRWSEPHVTPAGTMLTVHYSLEPSEEPGAFEYVYAVTDDGWTLPGIPTRIIRKL